MTQSTHGARAALYSAAATAFQYPDDAVIDDLTDPDVADSLRTAAAAFDLEDAVGDLLDAVGNADAEELQTTYTRLFAVPDEGSYPVVPYEANYTAPDEVGLQQQRIANVVGLLGVVDLEPSEQFDERQDHVAVELELMQVLAAMRAVAADDGDPDKAERVEHMEATVLREHLSDFVPALAYDLREATDHPVYRAAATLAERLVVLDNRNHDHVDPVAPGGEAA